MIVVPPKTNSKDAEDFFATMLIQQGAPINSLIAYPSTYFVAFANAYVGPAPVSTYCSPKAGIIADPSGSNMSVREFYYGTLSLTLIHQNWASGSTVWDGYFGHPIEENPFLGNSLYYQHVVSAAPSLELNKDNLYQWEGIGFSYLRMTGSTLVAVADSDFLIQGMFTGLRFAW